MLLNFSAETIHKLLHGPQIAGNLIDFSGSIDPAGAFQADALLLRAPFHFSQLFDLRGQGAQSPARQLDALAHFSQLAPLIAL